MTKVRLPGDISYNLHRHQNISITFKSIASDNHFTPGNVVSSSIKVYIHIKKIYI